MCEKCLLDSKTELNFAQAELARAQINQANSVAVLNLSSAAAVLDNISASDVNESRKSLLKRINMLLEGNTGELSAGEAQMGTDTSSAVPDGDDLVDNLPPAVRALLDAFTEAGVEVQVARFPKK